MTHWCHLHESIKLHVEHRISEEDAERQEKAAREILRRLHDQPGIILADEVGMGKTFVALAVAVSVALTDHRRRPVVVMVPSSLYQKWPQDFKVFNEKCMTPETAKRVRSASASSGVAFLKLLDDPLERRASIIFLTHGAMHRGLTDGWVKLAMIQRSLRYKRDADSIRKALSRCAGKLLGMGWVENQCANIWDLLLEKPPAQWLKVLHQQGIDPEGDRDHGNDDDPVPEAIIAALDQLELKKVYEAIQKIPQRQSETWDRRVTDARRALTSEIKDVWRECLSKLQFRLPLLVMDEAHHLKNDDTQLASLFRSQDAAADAEEIAKGALGHVFERMLFLTATPFQLGHSELCSVLERFNGIAWDATSAPSSGKEAFQKKLDDLRAGLDAAQHAALNLESAWGSLRSTDLAVDGKQVNVEQWWNGLKTDESQTPAAERVMKSYQGTFDRMRAAEALLRPWVLRHLRPRLFRGVARRERLPGSAIILDTNGNEVTGLEVTDRALVPFLLAVRATACNPESRPVFAEGLASSYEAFRDTRKSRASSTDGDDDRDPNEGQVKGSADWYLSQLEQALPHDSLQASATHPKIEATARRVLEAWRAGEKVLVFCHFIATGRTLRQVISGLLHEEIERMAVEKMRCENDEVAERLSRMGRRFFDVDSPVRVACEIEVDKLLRNYGELREHRDRLQDVCRRFIRTPSFLVRYFPLEHESLDAEMVERAFDADDGSGLNLRAILNGFFDFLAKCCGGDERQRYLDAINTMQTGDITGHDAMSSFSADELHSGSTERLLPNVRLVNGSTRQETRQRLMLTFNSPFFPEILVTSNVMAESVDLHRFCRYVIHHDLCWNPSTLEQRTGRVDRIGAKVEQCGKSIRIYLPFLSETQDEKQYRVVMDRERWFSVVMGENFRTDARSTDALAERIPLPESLARDLAFRLEAPVDPHPVTVSNNSVPGDVFFCTSW